MVNVNLYEDTTYFFIFCLKHFKLQINQNVLLIIAISISVVACNKTAEVRSKTAYVDTSVLMKEYTAKDLEAKYKAQSEERRQLEAEIKRFKQDASIFKVKHKRTVKVGSEKELNCKKRTTVELCPTSFVTTTATRKRN
jgi:cell division protein FtsB